MSFHDCIIANEKKTPLVTWGSAMLLPSIGHKKI